jgi:hypothetical protein
MKRFGIVLALVLAGMLLLPAMASASSTDNTYQFHIEVPNVSRDSHGDSVAVTGMGRFTEHQKAMTGGGTFTHTFAGGGSITGTWMATELLEFQPYGCGIVHNFPTPGATTPLPPNACGGAMKARVTLTATVMGRTLTRDGILTMFCIVGPNPPNSHDDPSGEGIHLLVPGITNFNKIVAGMNIYIRE